jgi:hypothetical protein
MLEKWRSLLAETQVSCIWANQLSTQSLEQFLEYENQVGFFLPSEYQEFCQIFGYGIFTRYWFCIECPDLKSSDRRLIPHSDTIAAIKMSGYTYPDDVYELLDSAYIFATGDGFIFFLFDLRTYSDADRSYDIYALDDENSNSLYYLGRSFFNFVQDICLGERSLLEFPTLINPLGKGEGSAALYGERAFMLLPSTNS